MRRLRRRYLSLLWQLRIGRYAKCASCAADCSGCVAAIRRDLAS